MFLYFYEVLFYLLQLCFLVHTSMLGFLKFQLFNSVLTLEHIPLPPSLNPYVKSQIKTRITK